MSRTADRRASGQPTEDRRMRASAAEVRHAYQALRTLVPTSGRVSATDIAVVTDLDRWRVPAAMERLAREGPFGIERDDEGELPAWTVTR